MLDENEIVNAIGASPDMRDALRVIARIAIREVSLRVAGAPAIADITIVGDLQIDHLRHTVRIDGDLRDIKPREFALLEALARRPGFVLTRGRLVDLAWPDPEDVDDERTVDVHVRRLRKILGETTATIRTVHGIGYTLDPPIAD